jgi:hypothetical protein
MGKELQEMRRDSEYAEETIREHGDEGIFTSHGMDF